MLKIETIDNIIMIGDRQEMISTGRIRRSSGVKHWLTMEEVTTWMVDMSIKILMMNQLILKKRNDFREISYLESFIYRFILLLNISNISILCQSAALQQ